MPRRRSFGSRDDEGQGDQELIMMLEAMMKKAPLEPVKAASEEKKVECEEFSMLKKIVSEALVQSDIATTRAKL